MWFLTCFSLMISGVECLSTFFMHVATCMSFLGKCLFRSSTCFEIWSFIFFILSCIHSSYVLDINFLLGILFANIFSHSVGCLPFVSLVSFTVQKLPSHGNQTNKRLVKGQIGREEVKFSLFAGAMTLHIEKLKDSTKQLLELMNEFRCRIQNYIHKSVVFLYTNNELLQIEIKKTITFTVK